MKEKLREFLRPRLAVLLAAALLAAYLPAMPAAQAADGVPTSAWEDQDEVKDTPFDENPTTLGSYTYSKRDGTTETVTVDPNAAPGSKANPFSIPDEKALILFGKLGRGTTQGKYYILDKSGGKYDMGAHTMQQPLMGEATNTSGMPNPSAPFQGVLIGNGASIENVCVNTENTVFGLFGAIDGAKIADLTVSLTSTSSADSSIDTVGGLVGFVRDGATLTNCTATVSGDLTASYCAGGLVGSGGTMTLTNCTATVGSLTAGYCAGGLAGEIYGEGTNLTDCAATVSGDLTAGDCAGGLAGEVYEGALTDCAATVAGSLTAGESGNAGGLVGLCLCPILTRNAAEGGESGNAGGLVGNVNENSTVTLTDCAAQAVITKPESGSCAPSGPVGEGAELVTFEGANVTTLRMGTDSSVSLALVNDTTLTLDDSGVLTATDTAANSDDSVTGSVTVGSGGSAVIQVHGGSDPDGRTYTLTGVNGTLRLEDKTPAEYWVTLDAGFTSNDPDPLARGDAVNLLGEAGNRLCTVTVEAGTGGSVNVTNGGPVSAGTEVTVTAIPDSGYRFVGWTEGGQQVSTEASYTFTVTSSRTLTAVFERTSSGGGSGGGGGGGTYTPPKKDEPQTGSSGGWKDIQKELENTKPGDNVDVDMNGPRKCPRRYWKVLPERMSM